MCYGVVCRCGLDPALPWLWYRPADAATTGPTANENKPDMPQVWPEKDKKKKKL